jgi:hypothetical protein
MAQSNGPPSEKPLAGVRRFCGRSDLRVLDITSAVIISIANGGCRCDAAGTRGGAGPATFEGGFATAALGPQCISASRSPPRRSSIG